MPQSRKNPGPRLDPRRPLVFSTADLGRSPGSVRTQARTVPAPAHVHAGMAGVPEGAEIPLRVQLEAVSEGVLVTATAQAPVTGECARCLEPVHHQVDVSFQELFEYPEADSVPVGDGYALHGDLLDLEPPLHDALVLALPLAPLCREDCPGLCVECGVQLAVAGPDHGHGRRMDPRWAGLQEVAARLGDLETGAAGQNGNGHRESPPGGPPGPDD